MDRLDEYKKFLRENNKCNSLREVEKFETGHRCKQMEEEIQRFVGGIIKNIPQITNLNLTRNLEKGNRIVNKMGEDLFFVKKVKYIIEAEYRGCLVD